MTANQLKAVHEAGAVRENGQAEEQTAYANVLPGTSADPAETPAAFVKKPPDESLDSQAYCLQDPSVQALAYLGDSVLELAVRERLVRLGLCDSGRLNAAALKYVKATAQSEALNNILPLLYPAEENIYKRGRNSPHIKKAPQSATLAEYRRASGFETLFGKLWLEGKKERICELFEAAYPDLKN